MLHEVSVGDLGRDIQAHADRLDGRTQAYADQIIDNSVRLFARGMTPAPDIVLEIPVDSLHETYGTVANGLEGILQQRLPPNISVWAIVFCNSALRNVNTQELVQAVSRNRGGAANPIRLSFIDDTECDPQMGIGECRQLLGSAAIGALAQCGTFPERIAMVVGDIDFEYLSSEEFLYTIAAPVLNGEAVYSQGRVEFALVDGCPNLNAVLALWNGATNMSALSAHDAFGAFDLRAYMNREYNAEDKRDETLRLLRGTMDDREWRRWRARSVVRPLGAVASVSARRAAMLFQDKVSHPEDLYGIDLERHSAWRAKREDAWTQTQDLSAERAAFIGGRMLGRFDAKEAIYLNILEGLVFSQCELYAQEHGRAPSEGHRQQFEHDAVRNVVTVMKGLQKALAENRAPFQVTNDDIRLVVNRYGLAQSVRS